MPKDIQVQISNEGKIIHCEAHPDLIGSHVTFRPNQANHTLTLHEDGSAVLAGETYNIVRASCRWIQTPNGPMCV